MPERIQKPLDPVPWGPKQGDGGGPRSPDVSRPDTKDLLKKMRNVDPNQSKRYRQRTGQYWSAPRWRLTRIFLVQSVISLCSCGAKACWLQRLRIRCHRGEHLRRCGNQLRRLRFWHSNFQEACWWQATAARPLATLSSTIARTRFWKSIGTRSWQLPACQPQHGKWRACSNTHFNIFVELNCRK